MEEGKVISFLFHLKTRVVSYFWKEKDIYEVYHYVCILYVYHYVSVRATFEIQNNIINRPVCIIIQQVKYPVR